MYFSFTNGEAYQLPDYCQFCELDTAGQHSPDCPYYSNPINYKLVELVERGMQDIREGRVKKYV